MLFTALVAEIFGLCPGGRNNFVVLILKTVSSLTGLTGGSGNALWRREGQDHNSAEV